MTRAIGLRGENVYRLEGLEERQLLTWGAFPQLIHQDLAAANFPQYNGAGQVIVDLDSGVNLNHPALSDRIWTNPWEVPSNGTDEDLDGLVDDVNGWNFIGNSNNVTDGQGHGTMVAGIAAANHFVNTGNRHGYYGDNMEYQGIAPGARVIALNVVDASGNLSIWAMDSALKWVIANRTRLNINVVNISLDIGYSGYLTVQNDLQTLWNSGVFIAAASGNGGTTNNVLAWPAASPYAMSVGACNVDGSVTSITTRGPSLAILAPGNGVPYLSLGTDYNLGGAGTSYAVPFISGAAAVIKQLNPAFTPGQIESIIHDSGADVYDSASGLTFKRLDLNAAIQLALSRAGIAPAPIPTWPNGESPFLAVPLAVPGIIQLENFDNGGEGVAYHSPYSSNIGGAYRSTGVPIQPSSDSGGGYQLSNVKPGEWLKYTVNIAASESYNISARVSSYNVGGTFHVEVDGVNVTGTMTVPQTGNWNTFTTVTDSGVSLSAGPHTLRLVMDTAPSGYVGNFNWLQISPSAVVAPPPIAPPPPPPSGETPFLGTPAAIPGFIQVENFDNGGEGVAYHDTDSTNQGGMYRATGVDIQTSYDSGGGYQVAYVKPTEWLKYTVNVAADGAYDLSARVSSYNTGGTFHMEIDGVNVTGAMSVPATGNWNTFTTVTKSGVSLTAGQHILSLVMDSAPSGYVGNFNWLQISPSATTSSPPNQVVTPPPTPTATPATNTIQSESMTAQSGVTVGSTNLSNVDSGDWLEYDNLDFGTGVTTFTIRIALANTFAGRQIQLHLDGLDQPIVGTLVTAGTGGWGTYVSESAAVGPISGVHNLFFTFSGGSGVGNMDWFKFA